MEKEAARSEATTDGDARVPYTLWIPKKQHMQIKLRATGWGVTMGDVILKLVESHLDGMPIEPDEDA